MERLRGDRHDRHADRHRDGPPTSPSPRPDNGTFTVTLAVTDAAGTVTDTETITAANVPPTATITGPAVTVPGLPATFTLGATDPSPVDQAAGFTFNIDWDGNGTVDQTVTGPAGTTVTHTFGGTGADTVTVTATDKDGGTRTRPRLTVQVKTAALVDDFLNPGQKLLAVGGTDGADNFNLVPGGSGRDQGALRRQVGRARSPARAGSP